MRARLRNLYGRIAGWLWLRRFSKWSRSLERMEDTVPWTWADEPSNLAHNVGAADRAYIRAWAERRAGYNAAHPERPQP